MKGVKQMKLVLCGVALAIICSGCGWQRYEVNAQDRTIVLEQYSFIMQANSVIPPKAYEAIQLDKMNVDTDRK